MYQNEEVISKVIETPDGEKDFQVRLIRDENVGIICTPTDKSYFLLDSADYWYDLIQEKYPPIMKCSCKNDRFNLTFEYTPREGTEDFREINIICSCTICQKDKRLPTIEIDYSPSSQLFDHPITFCKQPKIKYKTYSLMGYWSDDELLGIANYFFKQEPIGLLLVLGFPKCTRNCLQQNYILFYQVMKKGILLFTFQKSPLTISPCRLHRMEKEFLFSRIFGEKIAFLCCMVRLWLYPVACFIRWTSAVNTLIRMGISYRSLPHSAL